MRRDDQPCHVQGKRERRETDDGLVLETVGMPACIGVNNDLTTTMQGKVLIDLGLHDCRWAVNDAAQGTVHLFCGVPAEPGRPYCGEHCRLAYQMRT